MKAAARSGIENLPLSQPIFNSISQIKRLKQVPNVDMLTQALTLSNIILVSTSTSQPRQMKVEFIPEVKNTRMSTIIIKTLQPEKCINQTSKHEKQDPHSAPNSFDTCRSEITERPYTP